MLLKFPERPNTVGLGDRPNAFIRHAHRKIAFHSNRCITKFVPFFSFAFQLAHIAQAFSFSVRPCPYQWCNVDYLLIKIVQKFAIGASLVSSELILLQSEIRRESQPTENNWLVDATKKRGDRSSSRILASLPDR